MTGLWPINSLASDAAKSPPDNITLQIAHLVNATFAEQRKGRKGVRRNKPIAVPPLPRLDPVGERIRRELRRRRGPRGQLKARNIPIPAEMVGGTAHTRRGRDYNNEVSYDVIANKAMDMAQETLYTTQERIKTLDDYIDEQQRHSGTPALFNIAYTIRKMRGILEDLYVIYSVLYQNYFKENFFKHNVLTHIYYYTYCFKKYIDIIYYVEAVMVAYAALRNDNGTP